MLYHRGPIAGKFISVGSDTFAVGYRFATKRTGKKRVEENTNVSYFETQKTTRALI